MSNNEILQVVAEYKPAGDQPNAIKEIVSNIKKNETEQVLLGVTGSGKTFTMAKVIDCLLYTSPSPRDQRGSRMPSSA